MRTTFAILALGLFSLVVPAHAAIVMDNTADGTASLADNGFTVQTNSNNTYYAAVTFTVPAASSVLLDSLLTGLESEQITTPFNLFLYSTNGGAPIGAPIETWSQTFTFAATETPEYQLWDLSATSTILSAGDYAIAMNSPTSGVLANWLAIEPGTAYTSPAGLSGFARYFSSNAGSSWGGPYATYPALRWGESSHAPVPLPATLALVLMGAVSLFATRQHRT